MAREVARGARFPPLILVTTGPGGDLVVLEGLDRQRRCWREPPGGLARG
jgi:hypothetical protein